jgi:hypothetical protein
MTPSELFAKIKRRVNQKCQTRFFKEIKRSFRIWERLGFHITPNHFYEPIPDSRTLTPELWSNLSTPPGIELNEETQLDLLRNFANSFRGEYESFPSEPPPDSRAFFINNTTFESVDAEILYCMIRHFKPSRVIEVGSGFSTLVTAQAIQTNKERHKDYECDFTTIDPHPSGVIEQGMPGSPTVIPRKVQEVPLDFFLTLEANDILFIDSSHMLKIGSDVHYEYLQLLPRIRKGVIVHIHDIFLPAEYPKKWVTEEFRFFNEQYLLQAFLTFNDHFEILWAGSWMHLYYSEELKAAFKSYEPHRDWPGSFWMRRTK